MIILAFETANPTAVLYLYNDDELIERFSWEAHRKLAETIHYQIDSLLVRRDMTLEDVAALACFAGPGSFTGLRIGLSVANALAYGLDVPVVAASGEDWLATAIVKLRRGETDQVALPEYGMPVHITAPKK